MSPSISKIIFLDVEIYKDLNNVLSCTLFRKPTSGNTILHSSSFHPRPLINSVPYSEYLRNKLNCSNEKDYKQEAKALKTQLLKRGAIAINACKKHLPR